ncbi:hypothetical protein DD592_27230 [Enterobacter cloacae complex sp. 2DZ2F20B]|nr:hypothetical protein DD592_27230 [Enterobacter cloacae complex sp. 2DZ2F20B]
MCAVLSIEIHVLIRLWAQLHRAGQKCPESAEFFFVKMAQNYTPVIEKLKGRENYNTWKFGMQAYLEHEDLWGCITGIEPMQRKTLKRDRSSSSQLTR